jgi:hypothetical protein
MAKEIITRRFKAILSTKQEIKLDPSEVADLMKAVEDGAIIQVRQGIINPSYLVGVVEDKESSIDFGYEVRRNPGALTTGMKPLKDIFGDAPKALPPPPVRGNKG